VFVIHYWVGDCPEPASYVAVTGLTPWRNVCVFPASRKSVPFVFTYAVRDMYR
jgi:hypothetical protein